MLHISSRRAGRFFATVWVSGIMVLGGVTAIRRVSAEEVSLARKLAEQLSANDVEKRRDAAYALAGLAPDSLAALPELIKALSDDDTQVWAQATEAIASLGPAATDAIEALVTGLKSRDEQRAYRAAYALSQIGQNALPHLRENLRREGINATERAATTLGLGWLGKIANDTVPDLIAQLGNADESVRRETQQALERIGSASIQPLLTALDSTEPTVQASAAAALGLLGAPAQVATSKLLALAGHDNSQVVSEALIALARIQPHDESISPLLANRLGDERAEVRQAAVAAWLELDEKLRIAGVDLLAERLPQGGDAAIKAAYLISRLGPQAVKAIDALLLTYAADPQPDSTWSRALSRIGDPVIAPMLEAVLDGKLDPEQAAVVLADLPFVSRDHLLELADHAQPNVRCLAAAMLPRLSPAPKDLVARLSSIMGDAEPMVRAATAVAIGKVGPAASAAQLALETAAQDTDGSVRSAALAALAKIGAKSATLLDALLESLADADPDVRRDAAQTLSEFNMLPARALPPLQKLLVHDENTNVRVAAAAALSAMHEAASVTVLSAAIDSSSESVPEVRQQAIRSLGRLENLAVPALPSIVSQLSSDDPQTRLVAVDALAQIGKGARDAFPEINRLVTDSSVDVRQAAVQALRKVNDQTAEIVPPLVAALSDADWNVRKASATNLAELGEAAKPAVPGLLQMLRKDDESEVARAALQEIDAITEDAVPMLVEILQDAKVSRQSRTYVMFSLRKAGPAAKKALPVLNQLLSEAEGRQREGLQRTIDAINK